MRIEVEPLALIAAGRQTAAVGAQLGRLSEALGGALASGIASGTDPAGLNFGLKYGHQAQAFAEAIADATDAFTSVGLLLEATGVNYQNADDVSTIGGSGPTARVSGQPSKTLPAHVPPGPNGVVVPPPGMWRWVEPFLQAVSLGQFAGFGAVWPSGHSALMGLTAAQWRNFATGFALIEPQLTEVGSVAGRQSVPERDAMASAVTRLGDAISSLAEVASTVAQSVSDFASTVQQTQDAIRRLLDRISLAGLWDTVTGLLTGEGDNLLREVARDIGTVLSNLHRQVKAIGELLEELANTIGELATAFQKWIRPILVEHFGPVLGTALADDITFLTDVHVGALTGLIGTVSGAVALFDPDTWTGMAELAASVVQDPSIVPAVLANMGKEFVAWDQWSGEHPGRAAGEAAFNIGSLFVPGGPLSKTGSVAKGLNVTRRILDEGRLPQLGEIRPWTRGVPGAGIAAEVPPLKPAAIPSRPDAPSVAGPARVGESTPSAPGGRPHIPGAEPGPGQRTPVTQPGQPDDPAGTGARSESSGSSPTRATGDPGTSGGAGRADDLAPAAGGAARPDIPHPPSGASGHASHVPADVDSPSGPSDHTPHVPPAAVDPPAPPGHHYVAPGSPPPDPLPRDSPMFEDYTPKDLGPEFTRPDDGYPRYPDADLPSKPYAVPGTIIDNAHIAEGTVIDRFGHPGGAWLSPEGTPFAERALPGSSAEKPYYKYVVGDLSNLPPGWRIEQSEVAPWFHQPGGGIQYRIFGPDDSWGKIEDLVGFDVIEEIRVDG
ncbi:MAG: glycohydrolase toxin TNT-related protein [Mycobacterium sp.]